MFQFQFQFISVISTEKGTVYKVYIQEEVRKHKAAGGPPVQNGITKFTQLAVAVKTER